MGKNFSLLVKDGLICDGSGAKPFFADLGISGEKLIQLGKFSPAQADFTLSAKGYVVSPGFIDMHSHSDFSLLINPTADSKIRQGITTEVIGNCGFSAAPLSGIYREELIPELKKEYELKVAWQSFAEYALLLQNTKPILNLVCLIGQRNLRGAVLGFEERQAAPQEIDAMRKLLAQALAEGGWGVSTGLIYPPGSFARTPELIALFKGIASPLYASHIRNEGEKLLPAVKEAIEIGRACRLPVEVSHLKAAGKENWGLVKAALALMKEARADGIKVGCDVYPYTASSTGLSAALPQWVKAGGKTEYLKRLSDPGLREKITKELSPPRDWETVMISEVLTEKNRDLPGKTIARIAGLRGKEPLETVFDLLLEEEGELGAIYFSMCEADLITVMQDPHTCFGTDAEAKKPKGILGMGLPHPRSYGSFPRILARYVREKGVLTLEEAIHKMTALPAERLQLKDRGKLAPGYRADLVIFSPKNIQDKAEFTNPHRFPEGILAVVVNGEVVLYKGEYTGKFPGKVIRAKGEQGI